MIAVIAVFAAIWICSLMIIALALWTAVPKKDEPLDLPGALRPRLDDAENQLIGRVPSGEGAESEKPKPASDLAAVIDDSRSESGATRRDVLPTGGGRQVENGV